MKVRWRQYLGQEQTETNGPLIFWFVVVFGAVAVAVWLWGK